MGLTKPRASQIYNLDYKQSTRVVTVTNITLSGGAPSQVDGVNLSLNDRILVTGQSTASENGLYLVATLGSGGNGTWIRTGDSNETGEIDAGMIVMVTEGTTYADTQWKLITNDPITVGTTALTFTQNYSANSISGGTSNVVVNSNANVTISSAGTANVVSIGNTAVTFIANLLPASNVTYSLGNTDLRWKDLWLSNSTLYIGDVALATTGTSLTINGANVLTGNAGTAFSTSGNVTGGNVLTTGAVSATGNITGLYIFGDGSQLTGLPATYSNTNVSSFLSAFGSNVISTTGTITAGNITGDNILTGGLISATGTITSTANITGGNILAAGQISAIGNVTGSYIIGNGSQLTGLPAGYSNTNAASFLAAFGSNTVSTTGNITAGYFIGNGSVLTSITGANVTGTVANATYATTSGQATVANTANVVAGGNVSGQVANALVAGTVYTAAQPNITSVGTLSSLSVTATATTGNLATSGTVSATGNVYGGNLSASGNITATGFGLFNGGLSVVGNITASGNINYTNVTDLVVGDPLIYIGADNNSNLVDLGLIASANVANVYQHLGFVRNYTNGVWGLFGNVVAEPTTVIDWGNAVYQPMRAGNITTTNLLSSGAVSATGAITGASVVGGVITGSSISVTGTTTAASTVGGVITGSTVSLTGNVTTTGNVNAQGVVSATGNIVTAGSFVGNFQGNIVGNLTVPGSTTQVLFNTGGSADAVAGMTYNKGSNTFTVLGVVSSQGNVIAGNVTTAGLISATGNVTAGNVSATNYTGTNVSVTGTVTTASTVGGVITGLSASVTGAVSGASASVSGGVTAASVAGGVITGTSTSVTGTTTAASVAGGVITGTSVSTTGNITTAATGNISTGNILASGILSATGNITGGNISATNHTGTNVSVTGTVTAASTVGGVITGSSASVTGNITGGNVLNNGLISSTGNSTAANYLTAGLISATGNITGGNISTGGAMTITGASQAASYSATGNVTGGNINTAGIVSATGNITGGNISTGGTMTITGAGTAGSYSTAGNVTGGNILTTGIVSATGNITGNYFVGNGSRLTGIAASGGIKWTTQANTAPAGANAGDFWYDSFADIKYQYTNDGTGNIWIDQSFPTTFSTITVQNIQNGGANGTGNIGTSGNYFNTAFVKATSAQYADLAEIYTSDENYAPGTVVVFGGTAEITVTDQSHDTRVAGVISTNPAYLMNSTAEGLPVAFTGRVPCRVQGPVNKGDVLVTSSIVGVAQRINQTYEPGCVLGKSLGCILDNNIQIIEVVVGRF